MVVALVQTFAARLDDHVRDQIEVARNSAIVRFRRIQGDLLLDLELQLRGVSARESRDLLATAEEHERWHRSDRMTTRGHRTNVDVHLQECGIGSVSVGQFLEMRRDHLTRCAPVRRWKLINSVIT